MSDGNFNRALLPHTPYSSGLKAGKQIAKMKAVEAFREVCAEHNLLDSDKDILSLSDEFETLLADKLKA